MFAVSTGLDSFLNPQDIGPMYPFVDVEWLFVVIAVGLWLLWHALQIRGESREHRDASAMYDDIGLDRAMYHGGSALIATDEEWEEARRARGLHREGGRGVTEAPDPRAAHPPEGPPPPETR